MSVLTKFDLSLMGNGKGILDSLDKHNLSKMLERHCSNLNSVMTSLQMSRSSTDGILQPKQREQVENTLKGIVNLPTYVELVGKLNVEISLTSSLFDVCVARSDAMPHPKEQPVDTKPLLLLNFPVDKTQQLSSSKMTIFIKEIEQKQRTKPFFDHKSYSYFLTFEMLNYTEIC